MSTKRRWRGVLASSRRRHRSSELEADLVTTLLDEDTATDKQSDGGGEGTSNQSGTALAEEPRSHIIIGNGGDRDVQEPLHRRSSSR